MENKVWVVLAWCNDYDDNYSDSIEAIYQTEELAVEHLAYAREFYENYEGQKLNYDYGFKFEFEDESGWTHGLYYRSECVLSKLDDVNIYDKFRNES